jgi:hypothetical protein
MEMRETQDKLHAENLEKLCAFGWYGRDTGRL